MDISFCIVNLNAKKYLSNCLKSIPGSTKLDSIEIIVVDNNSYDGSANFLIEKYPDIKLIRNRRNKGYTKAMNQALRSSNGEYRVVLNPDTLLMHDSIDILIDQMRSDRSIGIVGPKVINEDGSFQKSCRRGIARPAAVFSYFLGLSERYPSNKRFTGYHLNYLDENTLNEVNGVSGSCMIIFDKLIDDIGYFDERYFAYQEDSDYCLMAINNGWKIYYNPEAVVKHYGGRGGAHSLPSKAIFEWHRSYVRYYFKHFSSDYSFLFNVFYYTIMVGKLIFAETKNLIKS
tara:strand:+ start:322 stop:1185 length:864 start_codon:yes stop_codon:yes gene_type:complete